MSDRILIVEDDPDISMIEEAYLQSSGYETHIETSGDHLAEILAKDSYDLILLDIMLPGKSGYELCKEIREIYDMPILMVTAKGESLDKIIGLNLGADDYITKPFDPAELVARVGTNLRQFRRISRIATAPANPDEIAIGNMRIQSKSMKVFKDDEELKLPNREFELLLFLAENKNIVFSREQLFERIWGYDYVGDSATVMVHINRIREKIEENPKHPVIIETVWGAGYRLNG